MSCLYPKLIKNKKYIANKKNNGKIPPLPIIVINGIEMEDKRVLQVPVECGNCYTCMKKKARNWKIRLTEELKKWKKYEIKYICMTFSTESLKELNEIVNKQIDGYERENEIVKIAMKRFLERWRKTEKKSVKHWFITELGGGKYEHIHLHGFLFTEKNNDFIRKKWKYGYIWFADENNGYINEKTINYIVKYMTKKDEKHLTYNGVVLCSPGIGGNYRKENKNDWYRLNNGQKVGLPEYYRNKIFTEEEREKKWRELLDKEEYYIMGQKYTDFESYMRDLEYYQSENERLGYGNRETNWELKKIERERRNIIRIERLKKSNI